MRTRQNTFAGAIFVAVLLLSGCGSDGDTDSAGGSQDGENAAPATQNACPVDGCEITIDAVEPAGDELLVTWSANFQPDFSKNHIHVYWDIYSAAQVSSDATSRGVEQGVWVPTDAFPTYTTDEVVSTAERGGSTTLCVTTSDGDHNVIDDTAVHCVDVSEHL